MEKTEITNTNILEYQDTHVEIHSKGVVYKGYISNLRESVNILTVLIESSPFGWVVLPNSSVMANVKSSQKVKEYVTNNPKYSENHEDYHRNLCLRGWNIAVSNGSPNYWVSTAQNWILESAYCKIYSVETTPTTKILKGKYRWRKRR